ncbi:NAD(P)-dependent alcohol dehydrogenase [Fibrisoma montanum]|uniref:NAD(P)-dependent alcohol dehydrogenase n=1 Tax=Fibrisoma montanum TaxID=2305895 RepID=A0A418MC80_9BACT|nr:NAD(P)-dependent alcohol dehydrogenase [Fibrisoma montanum]RIV23988.1 NAD(P)-dependent alcohol dehydrogenase [Fibrisoma montanum]
MKTVVYNQFGGTNVLQLTETETPTAGTNEVLVRIKAVSINPIDWKIRRGDMKLMSGSHFPKQVGADFAGVVEAVGSGVSDFSVGDEVFGAVDVMKHGVLADFAAVPVKSIWHKPAQLTFAQAASIPVVGAAAYTALIDIAHIGAGSEVLLNGASGGVGMLAIQIARQQGATVTAVVGPKGVPFARQWGANEVIDYTRQDVRSLNKQFDVVFDLAGKLPFHEAVHLMKDHAVFINPVPTPVGIISTAVTNLVANRKNKMLMSNPNSTSMEYLTKAVENGLHIEVSRTFPMTEVVAAYEYAEKGGYIGKVVIEL